MKAYSFTWFGNPEGAKAKQAHVAGKRAIMFTPTKTRNLINDIRLQSLQNKPPEPLDGSLFVIVNIYRQPPKTSKVKTLKMLMNILRPNTKPDLDNIEKALWDALEGIYYVNDSRIVQKLVGKFYSNVPRIDVTIIQLEEM